MSRAPLSQLPLQLTLRDNATFSNFYSGENATAVHVLQAEDEPVVFLAGGSGTGKTHLLQAVCHAAQHTKLKSAYVPLQQPELTPVVLQGLDDFDVVCLDDLDSILGNPEWERAIFNLFNGLRAAQSRLVLSAAQVPGQLSTRLSDLASRLSWGPVFQLRPLDDAGKRTALQMRASSRGLELPDEVTDFVLRRCARDPRSLFDLLDRLDTASLAAQRRLTIPFVRELI